MARAEDLVEATPRDGDENRYYIPRHPHVSPSCPCGEHHAAGVHRPAGGRTYADRLVQRERFP